MAAAILSEVPAESTSPELDRLEALEAVIAGGLKTFVDVGLALAEIRDQQLFRATHETFKSYLEQRWGFGQQWAYGQIYGARVAHAIVAQHGPLPAGMAADALRPLVPLLNREGPEAVAAAWGAVQSHYAARRRPPSRTEIRDVLASRGIVTTKPTRKPMPQVGQVGVSLERAAARIARIRKVLRGRPLPPAARRKAATWAEQAREIAAELDALADGSVVTARLRAVEPQRARRAEPAPKPGEVFCDHHGERRGPDGVCAFCGVRDLGPRR